MKPIRFIELEEKDWLPKAAFICPLCPKVLPKVAHCLSRGKAQALVRRSRKFHLKNGCGSKIAKLSVRPNTGLSSVANAGAFGWDLS